MDISGSSTSSVDTKRKQTRKRKSYDIRNYFEEVKDADGTIIAMKCTFPECNTILRYMALFNLERHFSYKHPKKEIGITFECGKKLQKLVVFVDKQEFLRNCIELVTVCHYPFNLFSKKCFRSLIDPIATNLQLPAMTPENMSGICSSVQETFTELIKNEVCNKLVSLKLDLATRLGRSMIGVNLQMIINGKIVTRTLGLVETTDRHTAKYIEKDVVSLLDKFCIETSQLYSTTTDCGSNVLKFVKLMISAQEFEFFQSNVDEVVDADDRNYLDTDIDELPEQVPNDLIIELDSILRSVKCSAHGLNLVVVEATSDEDIKDEISQARDLVKLLRSEPYKQSFKVNKKKIPFLDCATRWGYTYLMIDCLIQQESFIVELLPNNLKEKFDKIFWENCRLIHDSLKPVYIATKKVQEKDIVYGDFFILWKELVLELQEIDNRLSTKLVSAMEKRESNLFDNDAFLAAVFLDRRINYIGTPFITEEQQKRGMEHLLKTWKVIGELTGCLETSRAHADASNASSTAQIFTKTSRLEQMLQQNSKSTVNCESMANKLRKFGVAERLPLETNILKWWDAHKVEEPDLYLLACVALAVPCTQVSVERAFSGFGQVLIPTRTRLSKEKLEMVLFLKLNSELFEIYDININSKNEKCLESAELHLKIFSIVPYNLLNLLSCY